MNRFLATSIFFISALLISGCKKINDDCNLNAYSNAPEQSFFTSYNGSAEESHGHYILNCSDGGFLQIGEAGFLDKGSNILIVKIDAQGNLLWQQEFSEGQINLGNSAIEVEDGYLICGALDDMSTILKLNKQDGSLIFQKSHDLGGSNAFEHLAIYGDSILAVGYTNAEDNLNTFFTEGQGHLTYLNAAGDKIGEQSLNSYLAHAYRIEKINDGFMISGLTSEALDYGLLKIDSSGTVLWANSYGGSNSDHCFGMDISVDGFIFLTGHTLSGTENWDTYTMKISSAGDLIWESKNGNPRGFKPKFIHDEAWGIAATSDGGCIVVAGTGDEYGRYKRKCGNDGDNSNKWSVYLIKLSSAGDLEWQQTYGSSEIDWAGEDITLSDDGGAMVAVDNGSFGFLKIDPF